MPRISFPVDSPTLKELKQCLPWGMQCEVYRQLTQLLLDAVRAHGNGITGLIMHGEVKLVAKEKTKEDRHEANCGCNDCHVKSYIKENADAS